ncbi:MAG: AlpA family phage regulatory protein [Betaproteobacteria bacterium]
MITTHTSALTDLPAIGYVRQSQLIPAIVPFSSATLWRQVKAGTFPAPVKLSAGITAWRVHDIREWMRSRDECSANADRRRRCAEAAP